MHVWTKAVREMRQLSRSTYLSLGSSCLFMNAQTRVYQTAGFVTMTFPWRSVITSGNWLPLNGPDRIRL